MKNFNFFKPFLILIFIALGALWVFIGQGMANENFVESGSKLLMKPENQASIVLAHMDCDKGGRGHREGCMGKGMGHQGGMRDRGGRGHGMRHGMGSGPGLDGEAQCPQTRTTSKAPEPLYSKTNPLANTSDIVEKGRLLFQLDAQPSCTLCHGSGNGLGMMSGGLNPPPRNFTCKETMDNIPDGQLFWIIKNGSVGTGMPAFTDLNDVQVWQLIHYIRQFHE